MAPAVSTKGNRRVEVAPPDAAKRVLRTIAAAQAQMLAGSTWVGSGFATRARAMHDGDEPQTLIHGQATLAEAKALVEDGVPIAPLPLPVVPPEAAN